VTKAKDSECELVVVGANEILRVTADGQFVWNADADRMIKEGDFSFSPALPHILSALRKREWVGLTDEEAAMCWSTSAVQTWKNFEAKLKEKNT